MTYEFADRLIELRKGNGMSQEELAQRIGLSRQAVSKWERAESSPDIGNLVALAEIYGLTIDDIVRGAGDAAPDADEGVSGEEAVVVQEIGGESAQAVRPPDDVSKMPPPDPSQRVDWADAATAWHHETQAPPPGHPFGGHRGAPNLQDQPSSPSDVAAQPIAKPRKPVLLTFPYPVLCALLYLILGFAFGLWHPCWIIFFTIPFYYWVVNVVVNDPLWRARHGYLDD